MADVDELKAQLAQARAALQAAEHARDQMAQDLQAARQGLEEFSATVSHDLRAPLRHIHAYLDIVREELGPALRPDIAGYMDTVSGAAQRLGQQMEGLRAWAQLDRVPLQTMAVPLQPLVQSVCESLTQSLQQEAPGRVLVWEVAPDLPVVQADAALLRQALGHVLANAVKFTRPRSPAQVQIQWQLAAQPAACVLQVSDNGVGFNGQQQDRLCHVFQRLHREAEFEGLGLGLAMTAKIARRLGAQLRLEAAPDQGCRVFFTVPLA